jgi:plasmid maintenance system antidote protein VapI
VNIPKLKAKLVEEGMNVETLAIKIGIDRSTLYRKLDGGEKITIGEAMKIKKALHLTNAEASAIFFG